MSCSSTGTAPNNEISSAGSRKSSSTTGPSGLSLDILIRYIENVLSAITNQGLGCTKLQSGTELRDLVQPLASDFSKLFEVISEGAKMFSDQKILKSRLSTEAHSMAVDVLKGLGNAHWVAAGLLAIANVLERFDNISANDRECIDLLKDMLKLGKYLKQMRDLNVVFHKEVLEDMREAVQLILSGAILCRSFITSNRLSKFLLTKKIRDELVYLRGKVNSMKADLQGHVQLLVMKTLTCLTGRNEENNTEQSKDTQCEMEQSCETQLDGSESDNVSSMREIIDGYKQLEMPPQRSFQLRKFLAKIIPTKLRRLLKISVDLELQMWVKEIRLFDLELQMLVEFKRNELKNATKDFSQIIGKGGSASVYHGTLSDGRQVAVKMCKKKEEFSREAWLNELRISTKLQHPNILQLVGYCCEGDLMLVYDYMPRSLDRAIWEPYEIIIDWPTRYNIILDIIRGLAYLHNNANGGIVHRDIKPFNILLDGNLNAKICDFGLSRKLQLDDANEEIPIDGGDVFDTMHLTTQLCGTLGYMDQEFLLTGRVTLKSDIYSIGVVLLNIVSGKRAINSTEEIHFLSEEARRLHDEDRLTELIDPQLINSDGVTNLSTILRTIKIALCCINNISERRPSASQVLKMLSSEDEILVLSSPFLLPDYSYSEDEITIWNSSGESSEEQIISSPTLPLDFFNGEGSFSQKIISPTLPLDSFSGEGSLSQENWMPIFPPILTSADYNFSEEENWKPTPPMNSGEEKAPTHNPAVKPLLIEDHSSEEDIPRASPQIKSVVASANSLAHKIEESDRKWSGAYSKTLIIMLCVTSLVSFICLS